jgi:hypothetical protein
MPTTSIKDKQMHFRRGQNQNQDAYQSSQWLKLKTDLSICSSSHTNKKRVVTSSI